MSRNPFYRSQSLPITAFTLKVSPLWGDKDFPFLLPPHLPCKKGDLLLVWDHLCHTEAPSPAAPRPSLVEQPCASQVFTKCRTAQ